MKTIKKVLWIIVTYNILTLHAVIAQSPSRVSTTAASFLEIGYGPAGCSMGDAYVSIPGDISSQYWNPGGLSYMEKSSVIFSYQPWLVDINTFFTAAGIVIPNIGTFAIGLIGVDYGEMKVTSVEMQQGTGETFFANDYAFNVSFAKKLAPWFGFGATAKYIRSTIWHTSANAMALDLGVLIETNFFSITGREENGLKIGMSLSNYGTKMQYSGIDLLNSVDIAPNEAGNYKDSKASFDTDEWDIPLIFRVGVSVQPIVSTYQKLTIGADALHVNNNNETVNLGAEYMFNAPGIGKIFLRGGYRALFLKDSEFGTTFGFGVLKHFMGNSGIQFDYAYRNVGILGTVNTFGVNLMF